jgi:hypothetical protein
MATLKALTKRAMVQMFVIEDAVVSLIFGTAAPMRALAGESSATLNALRGKLDNKKHWQVAVLNEEIPAGVIIRMGMGVQLTDTSGTYTGNVEETDLMNADGVTTFYVS